MKYILVIGDGMADVQLPELNGKTPLEFLELPAFERCAGSRLGRVRTVPQSVAPGSDTAMLSIFGNDPCTCYTGRSVLEAAGMDVQVPQGAVSFRVNLCAITPDAQGELCIQSHNGGNIQGQQALDLMQALLQDAVFMQLMDKACMQITPTDTFRHIGVVSNGAKDLSALHFTEPHNVLGERIAAYLPKLVRETDDAAAKQLCELITAMMLRSYEILKEHPVNIERMAAGQLPANMIWPWGAATAMTLTSFAEQFGHHGSVISAVPLVWGIASLCGLKTPRVPGANGDIDTNYEGKVQAVLEALRSGDDFVAVHSEAPDEMGHAGNLEKKLIAIQNVCFRILQPLMDAMDASGEPYRLLLMPDHPTPLTTRGHDGTPVPFALYDSRTPGTPRKYSESEALATPLTDPGTQLMKILFEQC